MLPEFLHTIINPELYDTYSDRVWTGLATTLKLVCISYVIGLCFAVFIALGRNSSNKILRGVMNVYSYFFRGSPLLVQLYLIYFGLGSLTSFWKSVDLWWFFREPWYCALVVFTLNTAAYQAEILRGSFLSVDKGQFEAAKVLGLGRVRTFFSVICPQALMVAIRPLGNEFILDIKASAVVCLVSVTDLMEAARVVYSKTFDFEVYIWIAVLYLIIVECVRNIVRMLEKRLTAHLKHE